MKRLAFASLMLLVITNAAFAADVSIEALATKVVQLSGIEKSLKSLPEVLKAQNNPLAFAQLPDEKPTSSDAALSAFDPEDAKAYLVEYISENSDADTLSKTIKWLESPVGMMITAAEEMEKGLDRQAGQLTFMTKMKENPPAPERLALIRKLVQESGQLEMMSKMFQAMAVRMASAMTGDQPEVEAFARVKVKELVGPMEKQFAQQLTVADLYVYRDVSDSDLSSYIAFLESKAGKGYTKVILEGYGEIVEDLVFESQKDMIDSLKKQAAKSDEDDEECKDPAPQPVTK